MIMMRGLGGRLITRGFGTFIQRKLREVLYLVSRINRILKLESPL